MSETWDEAVERAMTDAPEEVRRAWRKLRATEAAALEKGARLIALAEAEERAKPPEKSPEVDALRLQVGELKLALEAAQASLAVSEQERRTDRMLLDKRENVSAQLEAMTLERDALRAEVSRLKWEASGARMKDEA